MERFVVLARQNRGFKNPDKREKQRRMRKVKFFRYSTDGMSLSAIQLPISRRGLPVRLSNFRLNVAEPYPEDLFVTEEWTRDVLEAILRGAHNAIDLWVHHHWRQT